LVCSGFPIVVVALVRGVITAKAAYVKITGEMTPHHTRGTSRSLKLKLLKHLRAE